MGGRIWIDDMGGVSADDMGGVSAIGIAPLESSMPIESSMAIKSCMGIESCMPIHLELCVGDSVRRGVEWHDTCVRHIRHDTCIRHHTR